MIAAIFGLEGKLGSESRLLSQGEKKLLDIASAFALSPRVILLDEPTSGVSSADKHGIMKTLIDAAKRAGVKAIILVEHDMDLVADYSSRIVALQRARCSPTARPRISSRMRKSSRRSLAVGRQDAAEPDRCSRSKASPSTSRTAASCGRLAAGRRGRARLPRRPQRRGKTTTFRAIMGYLASVSGSIVFRDEPSRARDAPHRATRHRLLPEDSQVFADLTVAENIELPTWTAPGNATAKERIETAYEIFPKLRSTPRAAEPSFRAGAQDGLDRAGARARSRAPPPGRAVRRASPPRSSRASPRASRPSAGAGTRSSWRSPTSTTSPSTPTRST
jgi:ABC-type branched-subunit amino acid transport system ATPase component